MLQRRHSVAFFYRIRLTSPGFLHSLSFNKALQTGSLVLKWSGIGTVLVGLVFAAGCATLDSRPAPDVVKERAEARANAYLAGDIRAAYGFFTPAARQTLKYEDYASSVKSGFWKAVTVDKVECEKPDICTVRLTVEYVHKGARIKSPLSETWIHEGKDWWYAAKD
jgi:hypothetical protein